MLLILIILNKVDIWIERVLFKAVLVMLDATDVIRFIDRWALRVEVVRMMLFKHIRFELLISWSSVGLLDSFSVLEVVSNVALN